MKARPVQIVQWHVRLHSLLPDPSLCLLRPELAARMEQIFARLSPRHSLNFASAQDQFVSWVRCPPARLFNTCRTLTFVDVLAYKIKQKKRRKKRNTFLVASPHIFREFYFFLTLGAMRARIVAPAVRRSKKKSFDLNRSILKSFGCESRTEATW